VPKKSSGSGKEKKVPATPDDFIDRVKDAYVDGALAKDDEKELQDTKRRFGITDRGSAAWAAGKIAEAEAEIKRREMQAKAYVTDAERWLERLKWLFWEALKEWARSNLDYGKRSVRLPTATLAFRDVEARLEVDDEEALKRWAIVECPYAITTVEQVLMEPLKDYWAKNNMVPPGTREIRAGENFSVKG